MKKTFTTISLTVGILSSTAIMAFVAGGYHDKFQKI
jgi:hypothetical protein